MSKRTNSSSESNSGKGLTAQEVVAYLEQHPDFLVKRTELLERMQIPHKPGQGMASLIERQVEVLREKNRQQEERLAALVENAHANEEITEKLHRYSMHLSATGSVERLLQEASADLQKMFDLDAVTIHIKPEYQGEDLQGSDLGEKAYAALFDSLGKASSSCHNELDDELLSSLFGEQASSIKSCALLALDTPHRVGLIALGSSNRERFCPQMGTLILSRLGEQFACALNRLHTF